MIVQGFGGINRVYSALWHDFFATLHAQEMTRQVEPFTPITVFGWTP